MNSVKTNKEVEQREQRRTKQSTRK